MAQPPDPERLAQERRDLAALEHAPAAQRYAYFARLSGPGFLQSAMTLGSGSAAFALFAGAGFGYSLLWVAPIAMLLGVIVLAAVSHQTLSTGMRPFDAMRRFAGAPFAWAWAIGALIASVIWHLPQYALASACLADLVGEGTSPFAMAFVVLAWAVGLSWFYGVSPRTVRIYEQLLKYIVWGIVLCFAVVVFQTGVDWGALAAGLFTFDMPAEANGVSSFHVVLGGLAAAVGINMVFLYPYSLLARGWGREHRALARFDLLTGMFVPYVLATSLMIIATANTIHKQGFSGSRLSPLEASTMLSSTIGDTVGHGVFLVGMLGMTLSTITLHMLTSGFVCSELFGWRVGSWKYRLATWIPTPAVFAPLFWSKQAFWIAIPTTIVCGLFLPIAYLGFAKLLGKRDYLGDDVPKGARGTIWRVAIYVLTAILTASLIKYVIDKVSS